LESFKLPKARKSRENLDVREFILANVSEHPRDIASLASAKFNISRQAVNGYLKRLISDRLIKASGKTRARTYTLCKFVDVYFKVKLSRDLPEDTVWRFRVLPEIKALKNNIIGICHYGFTEILNNAIDHSAGTEAKVWFTQNYNTVEIVIADNGIGIFEKIKHDFKLPDNQSALLELSKGKITSDTKRHAGEGIFYTSRMFDKFVILSKGTFYSRKRAGGDEWLIESGKKDKTYDGTLVAMEISTDAEWTTRDVFEQYSRDRHGFRKTHIPINLGLYPGEELVSRSQAKRILARFEQFSEVILDFQGVETIGQPFADEIFRVYRNQHPNVEVLAFNTMPEVRKMINYVQSASKPIAPSGDS